ncbi:MAG: hypothetical protein QOJ82_272 [Solirubrobacteraceae bacterium]|jgi:alpha-beta hydrolase superfamily lysophospholipase|nr:hypothetical protein [Solirubrobacteraceae bacterium]
MKPRVSLAVAAFGALLVLASLCHVPGAVTGVLFLSPALLLVFPLLCGRYVGEHRVARFAAAWRARRRPARGSFASLRRVPLRRVPRGGGLIACSLAVRPPPALLASR